MISTREIRNLVTTLGLRDSIIEKDYVISWLLWGISSIPELAKGWTFKGGTALKKCYLETWRYSEDLDFTVLPNGPKQPQIIQPLIDQALSRVHMESGIDFSLTPALFKHADKYLYTEGRIYYRGPLNARKQAMIKLDISGQEIVAEPTVWQPISHAYSDTLPQPATIRCYTINEIFAEKLRAMGQRGRPRDLYDIVLLFQAFNNTLLDPQKINLILPLKCSAKTMAIPTLESIQNATTKSELISEWENMLSHQVQELQPFTYFWNKLPDIFDWLNS